MGLIPVYVPTSGPPVAGVVHVPDRAVPRDPAVVLLPGLEAERIRIGAVRAAADELEAAGQVVLRVDHPGAGTSPGPRPERDVALHRLDEVVAWFRTVVGGAPMAVGGTCAGGAHALRLAANDPAIGRVVVQGGRLRQSIGKDRSSLTAALAAFDVLDRMPASVAGIRGTNALYDDGRWNGDLLRVIEQASRHASLHFLCGRGDDLHRDLEQLRASSALPATVLRSLKLHVLEVDRLNTVMDAAQDAALTRSLIEAFTQATVR